MSAILSSGNHALFAQSLCANCPGETRFATCNFPISSALAKLRENIIGFFSCSSFFRFFSNLEVFLLPEKLRQCLLQDSIPPRVQCLSIQPAPVDGTEGSHADLGVKLVESLDPPCQELPFMTIKYNIIHTSLLITNVFTYNNFTNSFQKLVRISKEMPPWPTP